MPLSVFTILLIFNRLRNETVYIDVWTLFNDTINDTHFKDRASYTITGGEEVELAWISADYYRNKKVFLLYEQIAVSILVVYYLSIFIFDILFHTLQFTR